MAFDEREELRDELDMRLEQIDSLNKEVETLRAELSAYRNFAKWTAYSVIKEPVDGTFIEVALRKLNKLGEVEDCGHGKCWAFSYDDEEEWFDE